MVKIGQGTEANRDISEAPGVYFHVMLAGGAKMNDEVFRIVTGVLEAEKDTILGRGKNSGREIDMTEILAGQPSICNK